MKTQAYGINLEHRCPVCQVVVAYPAAILDGEWYCGRHGDQVPATRNVIGIRAAVMDCPECPRYVICRRWITDVCFN